MKKYPALLRLLDECVLIRGLKGQFSQLGLRVYRADPEAAWFVLSIVRFPAWIVQAVPWLRRSYWAILWLFHLISILRRFFLYGSLPEGLWVLWFVCLELRQDSWVRGFGLRSVLCVFAPGQIRRILSEMLKRLQWAEKWLTVKSFSFVFSFLGITQDHAFSLSIYRLIFYLSSDKGIMKRVLIHPDDGPAQSLSYEALICIVMAECGGRKKRTLPRQSPPSSEYHQLRLDFRPESFSSRSNCLISFSFWPFFSF